MTTPLYCLLGFALWTLLLVVVGIGAYRLPAVARGEMRSSSFKRDTPHGPDWYRRTLAAHANCIENLPVFAAVVLTASVTDFQHSTFDLLALAYLGARVCQTIAHISSGRGRVINIRFTFFVIQLLAVTAMGVLVAMQ